MRKPKNYKNGLLPIYLKITVDGKPKELSAKRKWDPAKWNALQEELQGQKHYYLMAVKSNTKSLFQKCEGHRDDGFITVDYGIKTHGGFSEIKLPQISSFKHS